jgi:erythronate-4-phosphate dehydrogenase
VEKKARALGTQVLLCDPPLRESTGDPRYGFLEDVSEADILTLHVPLTRVGPHPTWHMIGREQIDRLCGRQFLINTCRGPVIDEPPLKRALCDRRLGGAVLDVWEGEPRIDYELVDLADLGSAHIAGFSLDGKVRATEMNLEALCRHFGLPVEWDTSSLYPPPASIRPAPGSEGLEAVASVVLQAYDILQDDGNLRALKKLPTDEAASGFDRLRNEYALRPEFHHFMVDLPAGEAALGAILEGLGFLVSVANPQGPEQRRKCSHTGSS